MIGWQKIQPTFPVRFGCLRLLFLLVTIASNPDTVSILHRGLNVHGCTAACSLLLLLSLAGPSKSSNNCSCAMPCLFQCEVLNRSQFHTLPHNNSSWPNQVFTVSPINLPCNIHALYPNKSPPETMLSINCSKPCPGYLCNGRSGKQLLLAPVTSLHASCIFSQRYYRLVLTVQVQWSQTHTSMQILYRRANINS